MKRKPEPAPLLDGTVPKVLEGQLTVEEVIAQGAPKPSQRSAIKAAVASKLSRRPPKEDG